MPSMLEQGIALTLEGDVVDTDGNIVSYTWESSIDGVLNAVIIDGKPVGRSTIQGEGAGAAPDLLPRRL